MSLEGPAAFIAGLALLIIATEPVLRGASRLANSLGVRPMVLGITVVAIGTSAPELAIGITASLQGSGGLVVGNIAGTNVVNILLILGLSALILPLGLHMRILRVELPTIIVAALLMTFLASDGALTQLDGALLFSGAVIYTVVLIRVSRDEIQEVKEDFAETYPPIADKTRRATVRTRVLNGSLLSIGILAMVLGASWLVDGAVDIAQSLGVSEAVIGLTIVAIGTSAPELVTTIIGTVRGDRDVAIGNLLGSSIYNIFVILGITCLVTPGGMDVEIGLIIVDIPLMAGVALLCLPVFVTGAKVSRREGGLFVAMYIAYLASIIVLRT